ncbi:hypothetical protein A6R68_07519, partial [Neotoma lepida]
MGTLEFPVDRSNVLSVACLLIAGGELKVGVYGKLLLHSAYPKKSWVHLGADIAPGNERIIVDDAVDWQPHDKVILSSSSYEPHEAEVLTIKEVKGHHIRIYEHLRYRHIGIKVNYAKDIILHGNVVAGSERLGFHISGHGCSSEVLWSDNVVHSSLHGLHLYKKHEPNNCTGVSGFLAFKNFDYGAMVQTENSVDLQNIT